MLSQPVVLASILTRDASRRKRVNRSAKLKQCKLDVRREQWLAHMKISSCNHEHVQVESGCNIDSQGVKSDKDITTISRHAQPSSSGFKSLCTTVEESCHTTSTNINGSAERSVKPNLEVKILCKQGKLSDKSCSSEDHGNQNQEDELEDWEAAADALGLANFSTCEDFIEVKTTSLCNEMQHPPQEQMLQQPVMVSQNHSVEIEFLKPEYQINSVQRRSREIDSRSWRSNEVIHHSSLPRLWQHSSHLKSFCSVWASVHNENRWAVPSAPLECPICTEELDSTDHSFSPCACGFRICLFCHHKISIEDGRCPGCRKAYNINPSATLSNSLAPS